MLASPLRGLRGGAAYSLRLPAPPPARAFWSLTAYGGGAWLVASPLGDGRVCALNSFAPLVAEPDGAIVLRLQPTAPRDAPAANWLPTPGSGRFSLTARFYWPHEALQNGSWVLPAPVELALHR